MHTTLGLWDCKTPQEKGITWKAQKLPPYAPNTLQILYSTIRIVLENDSQVPMVIGVFKVIYHPYTSAGRLSKLN